ncbi:MAG: hypothetical protein K6F09_06280 [Clostridiales bacterium]|nr:hypothetical protein [Clostridiales bacterium]
MILALAIIFSSGITCFAAGEKTDEDSDVTYVSSLDRAIKILSQGGKPEHSSEETNGTVSFPVCDGKCGHSPVIIVPGIMQSQVYVTDKEGNDFLTVDGFPIVEGMDITFMFDTETVLRQVKKMIWPMIKALLRGERDKFNDMVVEIAESCFEKHYFNPDGTRKYSASVDEYWYSLEEAKSHPDRSYGYAKGYSKDENGKSLPTTKYESQFDFIHRQVDMSEYDKVAGYDHAYYFAYSSFGDTFEIAAKLNDFIDMVKMQTGHDKVNLAFISLGGTIGNVFLAKYCDKSEIDRVVFAAAATDGSYLLSDLMGCNFAFDDKKLIRTEMIPQLIAIANSDYVWAGYLADLFIRLVPNKFFSDFLADVLSNVINRVLNNLVTNCPSMWALVPSGEYEALSKRLISDEAHAKLKEKTDAYYEIQKNAKNTVRRLTEEGMEIFVVCGYDLPMPTVFKNYCQSSDNIIQVQSTSMGATAAGWNKTFPSSYVPAIDKSYISPDNSLDAGTATLPDRTWFIKGQSHMTLQDSIHDTIQLCLEIVDNKEIKDARVDNGGYRQFNNYRNLKYVRWMLDTMAAKTDDEINSLGKEKKVKELKDAYAEMKKIYDSKIWDYDETLAAEKRLYTIMYKLKILPNQDSADPPVKKYVLPGKLLKFFKGINDLLP